MAAAFEIQVRRNIFPAVRQDRERNTPQVDRGTVLNGGTEIIGAGGVDSGTGIEAGGTETVLAGGLVYLTKAGTTGVTVDSGGIEVVSSGLSLKDLAVSGGDAKIAGVMAKGQRVNMAGAGSILDLASPAGFGAGISGFGTGDSIDFSNLPYRAGASAQFREAKNGTSGTLTLTDGATTQKLKLLGAYVTSNFNVTSDSSGSTIIKFNT